jgi:HEPN domain-containing protein
LYICEKQSLNEKVKYWIDLSDYDLETAEAMLVSGRYLYVGFICHQTIEKILKAYFCSKFIEPPPFSHNLSYLTGKSGINDLLADEYMNFIDLLEPLNIEARYPTHKAELLKSLSKERCEEILLKTENLQKWVKERL